MTVDLVQKHLPPSIRTIRGHINQESQGLQSTKNTSLYPPDNMHPKAQDPNVKTEDVIYSLISSTDKGFMDLTGRFPYCSSRGNEYILVLLCEGKNKTMKKELKNNNLEETSHILIPVTYYMM